MKNGKSYLAVKVLGMKNKYKRQTPMRWTRFLRPVTDVQKLTN